MGWLKDQWREFKRGRPGRRFQDRYERNKEARSGRSQGLRFLKPVAGGLLLVAGVVFCLIPGPGLPLLLIGAGLLADVSLPVAKALDGTEVRARKIFSRMREGWRKATMPAKCAVVGGILLLAGGAGYGGFRLVKERMEERGR